MIAEREMYSVVDGRLTLDINCMCTWVSHGVCCYYCLLCSVGQILQLPYVKTVIADFVTHSLMARNVVDSPATVPKCRSEHVTCSIAPPLLIQCLIGLGY